jgi:hypothetical protein
MIEAAPGTVWIADSRNSRILAVSDSGRRFSLVARDGEGPGEVHGPDYMARSHAGDIAVYSSRSVDVFSRDGDFIRRVRMRMQFENVKGFTVLPSGAFVVSGGSLGNGYSVHRISADGRSVVSWDSIPKTRNPRAGAMVAGGVVRALDDGRILFSRSAPHEIAIFSSDGKHVDTIAHDPDLLKPIGDDFIVETVTNGQWSRSFRWFFPQARAVFRLENGDILNVVDYREQDRSLWELYRGRQRIAKTIIPRAYRPWNLTSTGDILASYIDPYTDEPVAAVLHMTLVDNAP